MKKITTLLVLMLALAACSTGRNTAPRNMENACSILRERPHYAKAFSRAERKWGIPVSSQMAMIYQESRFKSHARPPKRYFLFIIPRGRASSARGYAQVIDSTWSEYKRSAGRWGARRENIRDAADFIGWYTAESARSLGISKRDTRAQYLAYHEGRTGYRRGSHNSKGWLLSVANAVDTRARRYESQLSSCRRLL